jgi:hypothetical protein
MSNQPTDTDTPWKQVLDTLFPQFLDLCFPDIFADTDWPRGYEFRESELQQVLREAETGSRTVDRLVKVWRRNGGEAWVLVHVEVQAQREARFPRRMYEYNWRLADFYARDVASLAVLADDVPGWRPVAYERKLWGCRALLEFPTVKLFDFGARWPELEASDNPFALVIMIHLKALETRKDPPGRFDWKRRLASAMYRKGHSREDVLALFRFIDWLMFLPNELEQQFVSWVKEQEEQGKMPYLSNYERQAEQRGREAARGEAREEILTTVRHMLLRSLRHRFNALPDDVAEQIQRIEDAERLQDLFDLSLEATDLSTFRSRLE